MTQKLAILALTVALAACSTANQSGSTSSGTDPNTRVVKSQDGSFEGEIVGTPREGSKFAGLKIGMQMSEVQSYMSKGPDRWHTYESGKRWIPFYFGNDARRMQVLYNGEGCLIFTDGSAFGGSGGDLIQIQHDATGACYQP